MHVKYEEVNTSLCYECSTMQNPLETKCSVNQAPHTDTHIVGYYHIRNVHTQRSFKAFLSLPLQISNIDSAPGGRACDMLNGSQHSNTYQGPLPGDDAQLHSVTALGPWPIVVGPPTTTVGSSSS